VHLTAHLFALGSQETAEKHVSAQPTGGFVIWPSPTLKGCLILSTKQESGAIQHIEIYKKPGTAPICFLPSPFSALSLLPPFFFFSFFFFTLPAPFPFAQPHALFFLDGFKMKGQPRFFSSLEMLILSLRKEGKKGEEAASEDHAPKKSPRPERREVPGNGPKAVSTPKSPRIQALQGKAVGAVPADERVISVKLC
jgi:hypothetical protein